jgi:hypothetical protein
MMIPVETNLDGPGKRGIQRNDVSHLAQPFQYGRVGMTKPIPSTGTH